MIHFSAEYNGDYLTPEQIDQLHTALLADLAAMADDPEAEEEPEAELEA